tara:strand:+ start:2183 stop:3241 length:1059 start_codon:yes stop_codon:yes gene_type:complete
MSHSGIQRLTFVGTDQDLTVAGTAYGAIASGAIGIWDVDAATYLSAAESFLQTNFVASAAIADTSVANPTDVTVQLPEAIVPKRFQIVQGQASGNPKCSPIIYSDDVIKINSHPATASVAAFSTVDMTGAVIAVGEIYSFKLVIRGIDTSYQGFINPSDSERISYVGQVINFERTATLAGIAADLPALVTEFNAITDMPFTASFNAGTDVLTFTCDIEGVEFDLLADFSGLSTQPTVTTVTNTAFVLGNGDGKIIAGYEKMSRAYFGRHNNVYLPQDETLYAVTTSNYDTVTLTWDQSNKGHANPWLFTGENSITIAVIDGLSTQTNWDNAWNITLGTTDAEIYNKHNSYVG